jgi:DNA polymerase III subunit gamma/tau
MVKKKVSRAIVKRRDTITRSNDLNVAYRPCLIDEVLGNETNKKIIKNALDTGKVPRTQLFTGDAGCGKTTAAKIIALGLNCEVKGVGSEPCLECPSCKSILEGSSLDVREINVGQSGGKAHVDALINDLPMSPFNTRYKVLIFDEAHELTTAAKDLLLKPIESGYEHVYFIFCTNQPEKLRSKTKDAGEAFLDRCSILNFGRVTLDDIRYLLNTISEFEGHSPNSEVIDLISEESKGVPRSAIMWLNQVIIEGSWTIEAAREICKVLSDEEEPLVIELCRALNKADWKEAVRITSSIKTIPIETLRIYVSRYFVSCLSRSQTLLEGAKYSRILDVLLAPIYEQGKLAEYKWLNYLFKVVEIVVKHSRVS